MIYVNDCGIVSALGRGKTANADALFQGKTGIRKDGNFYLGKVGGELPAAIPGLDCRNNRMMQLACEEIKASVAKYSPERVAVVMGTSTSGIADAETTYAEYLKTGQWPEDYHYRRDEVSSLSTFVAKYFGVRGPAYTVATACSSSAKVFASARRLIEAGFADAAIVGGCDTLCQMTINGFNSLEILSAKHCQPFSASRNGINIGEGAAVFLLSRDAGPVKLLGVGETSDAYHLTAPDPEGGGAQLAMKQALDDAGINAGDIGYINLHGTATPLNDAMESRAVAAIFGKNILCSSTKALTGHTLGAAGAIEAAFMWLALTQQKLPPHIWDSHPDPQLPQLNFATAQSKLPEKMNYLSNSFGFGGSNASIIFGAA